MTVLRSRPVLLAVAATAALSACAGPDTGTVPYGLTLNQGTQPKPLGVTVEVEEVEPEAGSDHIPVSLTWSNNQTAPITGSSSVKVISPKGVKVESSPDCRHALVNDLVCVFEGTLTPGQESQRLLEFSVTDELSASGADIVFRSDSGETSIPVNAR